VFYSKSKKPKHAWVVLKGDRWVCTRWEKGFSVEIVGFQGLGKRRRSRLYGGFEIKEES